MRRQMFFSIVLILFLTLPGAVAAQNVIVPFIGGGLARGIGDLADDTGNGWMAFGGIDLAMDDIAPGFAIGLTGTFAQIPYSGAFNEAAQVTGVTLEASYHAGEETAMLRPYVRGGGGLSLRRYEPGDITTQATTLSGVGFSAGAGVNILAGSVDVIVGGRFNSAPDGGFVAAHVGIAIPIR